MLLSDLRSKQRSITKAYHCGSIDRNEAISSLRDCRGAYYNGIGIVEWVFAGYPGLNPCRPVVS